MRRNPSKTDPFIRYSAVDEFFNTLPEEIIHLSEEAIQLEEELKTADETRAEQISARLASIEQEIIRLFAKEQQVIDGHTGFLN